MLIFKTDKDYGVYLEEDGDDLWITVTNGYCKSYDCIVGSVADACDTKICVETAYTCFFPAQYVNENIECLYNYYIRKCINFNSAADI